MTRVPKGLALGRTLARELSATLYAPARLAEGEAVPFASLSELVAETFHQRRAHVFLCACGIAVRAVAPHLAGKARDPAVVVTDELGTYSVSLLSGHSTERRFVASLALDSRHHDMGRGNIAPPR